ncbi:LAME_0A02256g1_1 [Lachancea meyersii CBS 8951]|uniref:LAME_0A02256g1_1 n=1 Tax=Lachancea meyersii CBS 8951 TaxID=1266667 RepID=A0A1G4IN07_9SACH|nr:LAME_0A02256g1_1 [Lachancea meyersii CBS 8951]
MDSFLDYAQYGLTQLLTFTARFLSFVIPLLFRFTQTHPTITNVLGYVLAAYISWKLLCHLWTVIKRIMLVFVIIFAVLLWSRGLHQVVSHDVPVLMQYLEPKASLPDLWNRFIYYVHPAHFKHYYSTALRYHLETLRDRSLQVLASMSN